jgi:DNA repair protein RadC
VVKVTVGTLDASLVHPREVFKPAFIEGSAAILLSHNHPSGNPEPSREDILVTDRLTEAGKLLGINVLDHIIHGDGTGEVRSIREVCLALNRGDPLDLLAVVITLNYKYPSAIQV